MILKTKQTKFSLKRKCSYKLWSIYKIHGFTKEKLFVFEKHEAPNEDLSTIIVYS